MKKLSQNPEIILMTFINEKCCSKGMKFGISVLNKKKLYLNFTQDAAPASLHIKWFETISADSWVPGDTFQDFNDLWTFPLELSSHSLFNLSSPAVYDQVSAKLTFPTASAVLWRCEWESKLKMNISLKPFFHTLQPLCVQHQLLENPVIPHFGTFIAFGSFLQQHKLKCGHIFVISNLSGHESVSPSPT